MDTIDDYDYGEKKIVVVVSSELETGTMSNVIGHLAISVGHYADNIMGRRFLYDADGVTHIGISKYPVITVKAKPIKIKKAIELAKSEGDVFIVDYPKQIYYTEHDDDLAECMLTLHGVEIEYWGAVFVGKRANVDKYTKRFSLL